jgi:hypothetical protein
MKKLFELLGLKNTKTKTTLSQRDLINYVQDKSNVEEAVKGSMEKRLELLKRVHEAQAS